MVRRADVTGGGRTRAVLVPWRSSALGGGSMVVPPAPAPEHTKPPACSTFASRIHCHVALAGSLVNP